MTLDINKAVFPISVTADILKIHPRTLRIYDKEGVLVPSRSPKNRRLYSHNDLEKGKFVQYLTRELGINLTGVKIILFHLKEQYGTNYAEYFRDTEEIAEKLGITQEIQAENKIKLSKRGRKKQI